MNTHTPPNHTTLLKKLKKLGSALLIFAVSANVHSAVTDLATSPLTVNSTVTPNIMFVLDDSGSMASAYMPDTTLNFSGKYGYMTSQCNGVYYNPRITYTPPVDSTGASYANASFTAAYDNGYKTSDGSTDLSGYYTDPDSDYVERSGFSSEPAFYYQYTGTQTTPQQKNYYDTNSTFYKECNSTPANSASAVLTIADCGGTSGGGMTGGGMMGSISEMADKVVALLTGDDKEMRRVSFGGTDNMLAMGGGGMMGGGGGGCSSTGSYVNGITVNGKQIMKAATASTTSISTLAGYIAAQINLCTSSTSGNCTIAGYSAMASGSQVLIIAPTSLGNITYTPSISMSTPDMTFSSTAFSGGTAASGPGASTFTKVVVSATSGDTANGMPADERQNFANWYTYYRTRINTMKTAAGLAFKPIDTNFRVSYMSINNNVNPSIMNFALFGGAQKSNWYTKLYAATPGGATPLRVALSNAGRIYANKLTSLYGVAITDPMQYSCQKNFTILSTDGFWNGSAGYQLDGATAVGNQDGNSTTTPRPLYDGTATSDTLADVAQYYYATDLRTTTLGNCTSGSGTGATLCAAPVSGVDSYDNVRTKGDDTATWQHMTTFTLGLGTRGSMVFDPSLPYMSASSGDFYSVRMGSTANSATSTCTWQTNGTTCNWPVPVSDTYTNIDDLWHAAVNGRGIYYSAADPAQLSASLNGALDNIKATGNSMAAMTVSNQNMSTTDNFIFGSNFSTGEWSSELFRQHIDMSTGLVAANSDGQPDWKARDKLDLNASRTIYTYDPSNAYNSGGTNKLKSFVWANLSATEQNYFKENNISSAPPSGTTGLSQFLGTTADVTALTSTNKDTSHAAGSNLVSYLRGDRTYEGAANDNSKYYRLRTHLLGDIGNAETPYVKAPLFSYADPGYGTFKAAYSTRQAMVYAAANDGMLHAFYAYGGDGAAGHDPVQYMNSATGLVAGSGTQVYGGAEAWAYIPTPVLPRLFTLADKDYANKHQFFVDGTPVTGDIYCDATGAPANCPTAQWKTIVVGGLNGGGKGYYALDITNPAAPKALWEFTTTNDANLGYTYGNPVIIKLKNGTWVVLVASGYNNADGVGRLYVLNATTGALIRTISTGIGSAGTPSGLAQISAMVAGSGNTDNTVLQVYGGDLLGNLWRFDVNGDVGAAGYDAQLLVTLKDGSSNVQPITTSPQIGIVDTNTIVYVGTGRYLGTTDSSTTSQQSMYAIKDPLAAGTTASTAIYSDVRAATFVQQTLTNSTCTAASVTAGICSTVGQSVRTASNNAVDLSSKNGWYMDLKDSGERISTDPQLAFGTLVFTTNVPTASNCVDGYSWEYYLDYRTGAPVTPVDAPSNTVAGKKLGLAMASHAVLYQLPNGSVRSVVNLSGLPPDNMKLPTSPGTSTRRTSWRELITE